MQGHGQKSEQKHRTKNFARLPFTSINHVIINERKKIRFKIIYKPSGFLKAIEAHAVRISISLVTYILCYFLENRGLTASSVGCVTRQTSAIRKTRDLNAFHRSPGVHGPEVCTVVMLLFSVALALPYYQSVSCFVIYVSNPFFTWLYSTFTGQQNWTRTFQGRSQDFSKGGGHTGLNNIVMAFLRRNIVGCLLKKGLQRGGHGHPQDPPSYAPAFTVIEDGVHQVDGPFALKTVADL